MRKLFRLWWLYIVATWAIYGFTEGTKEIPWSVKWKNSEAAKNGENNPYKKKWVWFLIKENFDYFLEGFSES